MKNRTILGVNCVSHDASASVIMNGVIKSAVEEERYTRKKHTIDFPKNAIEFCLDEAGAVVSRVKRHIEPAIFPGAHLYRGSIDELITGVDYLAIPMKPFTSFRRTARRTILDLPKSVPNLKEFARYYLRLQKRLDYLIEVFGLSKIVYTGHHEAHMASAFFTSPFERSAILSIDGSGDDLTTVIGVGEGNRIRVLDSLRMPHSVGYLYQTITQLLGFRPNSGEGKVMGLAPYGRPNKALSLDKIATITGDGFFRINPCFFNYVFDFNVMYGTKLVEMMGEPRIPESDISPIHEDVAFALQKKTEEIVFHILNRLFHLTGCRNICITGGVGLNSVLNGKITENTPFENIYVPAAPADNGTSMGSALWVNHQILGNPRSYCLATPYLGPEFSNEYIENVLERERVDYARVENPGRAAAELIAKRLIIGWFQGRTEFGARALGNRSILADPRDPNMKDKLNYKIKHREGFRPFAPSVLAEYQDEYFEKGTPTFYMSEVYTVRPDKRGAIPAVIHIDGTGRLQTVSRELNPLYHSLISELKNITGVPLVINTSFNVRGEPIVNSPEHALNCFSNTGLDRLVIGNYVVKKKVQE